MKADTAKRLAKGAIKTLPRVLGPIGAIIGVLFPEKLGSGELTPEQRADPEQIRREREAAEGSVGQDIARAGGVAIGGLVLGGQVILDQIRRMGDTEAPPPEPGLPPPEPQPEPEPKPEPSPTIAQERRSPPRPAPTTPEKEVEAPAPAPAATPAPRATRQRSQTPAPTPATTPAAVPVAVPAALGALAAAVLARSRSSTAATTLAAITPAITAAIAPTVAPAAAPPLTPTTTPSATSSGEPRCKTPAQQRKDDKRKRDEKRKQCRQFLSVRVPAHKRKMCIGDLAKYLLRKLERTTKREAKKKIVAYLEAHDVPASDLLKLTKRPRPPKAEVKVGGVEIDLKDLLGK
jgi:hypothetical protein